MLDVTHSGRSFMNIKNNSGLSTVPWGTPLTTLALLKHLEKYNILTVNMGSVPGEVVRPNF
jgi:hypothetical protein